VRARLVPFRVITFNAGVNELTTEYISITFNGFGTVAAILSVVVPVEVRGPSDIRYVVAVTKLIVNEP
jgi:hypothetical protein